MNNSKWDERFLELARHYSEWSKDPSTKVGAVIVDPSNVLVSIGFNGLPMKCEDKDEVLDNREEKYEKIIHAEMNALVFAKRDLTGHTLYTWPFMPCSRCCSVMIQAGITRIVAPYNDNERWSDNFNITRDMCREAGVTLIEVGKPNEARDLLSYFVGPNDTYTADGNYSVMLGYQAEQQPEKESILTRFMRKIKK